MASLENPCVDGQGVQNTGVECGKALSYPQGVILCPSKAKWTKAEMVDPYQFFQTKIHAAKSTRFYPVFADLKKFEVAEGSDQTETYDDGTTSLIRLGGYGMTLSFKEGGECLAKKLLSFNKKGYSFIIVDELGQFKVRKNADGTYSGLKASDIYGSRPELATSAAVYKNRLVVSISVEEYITNSEIFKSDADLSDLLGLLDVDVVSLAAATTTKVTVGASTECAGTDLYALFGDALAVITAWKIVDKATGLPLTISAAAKNVAVSGWDLTVATGAGKTVLVNLTDAATLMILEVEGYEGAGAAEISMPAV